MKTQIDSKFLLRELIELNEAWKNVRLHACANTVIDKKDIRKARYHSLQGQLLSELIGRRTRGESYAAIAIDLNRRGLRGRYGARWYTSSVRALIQRTLDI
jgi:hypothetical protein